MIRYITFSSFFVDMKKEGFIRPFKNIQMKSSEQSHIIFEKDWRGDAYFKAMFIAMNSMPSMSLSPFDLIALIFNEQDLLLKGYMLEDDTEIGNTSHRTQLESMKKRGEITEKEYKELGNFVFIKGEIRIDYIVNVDIPDENRLKVLGLI